MISNHKFFIFTIQNLVFSLSLLGDLPIDKEVLAGYRRKKSHFEKKQVLRKG